MPRQILMVFFCALMATVGPAWAAQRNLYVPSADDFTERLQDFQKSVSNLELANSEFSQSNAKIKEHIRQGKAALESLKQDQVQWKKELELYGSKTHKQSDELKAFESKMDELKSQVQKVEQQISAKQEVAGDRMVRQKVIWDQLAAVKVSGVADLDERNATETTGLVTQKVELSQQLENRQRLLNDLESQIEYQSLFKMDPAVSLPRLTAEREKLEKQLSALSPQAKEPPKPSNKEQIIKLEGEVRELGKVRSEQTNLLQMLELQYDKNQKSPRSLASEKKLQESVTALKKENKLLRQQAADMRFEMIDLDKRKSRLERLVSSSR